jgi:hypothetical protein
MSFPFTPGFFAGSTVAPMSFVKMSGVRDWELIQAGLNDRALFIVQQYQARAPGVSGSDQAVAATGVSTLFPYGQAVAVYAVGDQGKLRVSTTVAAGDPLKSDANGWGQTATTAGDVVCAYALEAGTQSTIINVYVTVPVPYN